MHFSVPQFVNVEDKIAFGMTWKQIGWMIVIVIGLILLYKVLEPLYFYIIGIPSAILLLLFAFYRPLGEPLINTVGHAIVYMFGSRKYTWRRETRALPKKIERVPLKKVAKTPKPKFSDISELADILDTPQKK